MSNLSNLDDMLSARNELAHVCAPVNIKYIDHDIMTMLYDCWIFLNQLIVEAKDGSTQRRTKHVVYRPKKA
jgi:hypothetical protein